MKQWPQGLWVVTPEGKVLGFHYHKPKSGESTAEGQRRWLIDTLTMLRTAAKEAGPLTVREVKAKPGTLADRGRGLTEEGGVRLALSVVALRNGRPDGPPVLHSIGLDTKAWASLAPPAGAKVGTKWEIPEAVARRFAPALSPLTDPIFGPTPADVNIAKITANVERIDDKVTIVRYAGRWESQHNRDGDPKYPIHTSATGAGVGVFSVSTGKAEAMAWMLNGGYRTGPSTVKPRPTVAIAEWTIR